MKYRKLGKTNFRISVVGVGTWQFGGSWGKNFEQSEVDAILNRAKEKGINLLDTAECYGPGHKSETFIGHYLKNENRDDWVVATKFGHVNGGDLPAEEYWSASEVEKQLNASLKALQTDFVDLYQFHSGTNEVFDNDELWAMLQKQKQAGKIRHIGISIRKGIDDHQVKSAPEIDAEVIQIVYNRLDRDPEGLELPVALEYNLGVLARVPLASGFLSGKYKAGTRWQKGDVRSKRAPEGIDERLNLVAEIQKNEVPEGVDMATWALGWCLKHDAVSTVIPGCKTVEQVDSNAAAADLDLVAENHPQAIE